MAPRSSTCRACSAPRPSPTASSRTSEARRHARGVPPARWAHAPALRLVASSGPGLAAVLGHEVGHVLARHSAERLSESLLLEGGLTAISAAMGDSQKRPVVMAALGLGATVGIALPHSRRQEAEADAIGVDLMANAGF